MEKMTVKQFAEKYSKCTSDAVKAGMLSTASVKHYLPITEKRDLIENTLHFDLLNFDNSFVTFNSIDKMVTFMGSIIAGYTDFEREDPYEDFDVLMETGLMSNIIAEIGSDVDAYRDLFEMRLNDYIRDNNSLEAITANKLGEVVTPVKSILESIDGIINDLTFEEVMNMVNAISMSK